MYSRTSVCFYEKQTPLQYLHPLAFFYSVHVSVMSVRKQKWGERGSVGGAVTPL